MSYPCSIDLCRGQAQHSCFECEEDFCKKHATECSTCSNYFCLDDTCQHPNVRCQEIRVLAAQGKKAKPRSRRLPAVPQAGAGVNTRKPKSRPSIAGSKQLPTPGQHPIGPVAAPARQKRSLPTTPHGPSPLEIQQACTLCSQKFAESMLENGQCMPCSAIEKANQTDANCIVCLLKPQTTNKLCMSCSAKCKRLNKKGGALSLLLSTKLNPNLIPAFTQLITLAISQKDDDAAFNTYYLQQLLTLELYLYPYQNTDRAIRASKIILSAPMDAQPMADCSAVLTSLYAAYQEYFSAQKPAGDINTLLSQQQKTLPMLIAAVPQITALTNKPHHTISNTIEMMIQGPYIVAANVKAPIFRINHARILAYTLPLLLNRESLAGNLVALLEQCLPYIVLSYSAELYGPASIPPLSNLAFELRRP